MHLKLPARGPGLLVSNLRVGVGRQKLANQSLQLSSEDSSNNKENEQNMVRKLDICVLARAKLRLSNGKETNVFWHSGGVMSNRSRYTQHTCAHTGSHTRTWVQPHTLITPLPSDVLFLAQRPTVLSRGVVSDTRRLCFLTPGQLTGRFYCARDSSLPNLTASYSVRTGKATCFSPPVSWRFVGPAGLGG